MNTFKLIPVFAVIIGLLLQPLVGTSSHIMAQPLATLVVEYMDRGDTWLNVVIRWLSRKISGKCVYIDIQDKTVEELVSKRIIRDYPEVVGIWDATENGMIIAATDPSRKVPLVVRDRTIQISFTMYRRRDEVSIRVKYKEEIAPELVLHALQGETCQTGMLCQYVPIREENTNQQLGKITYRRRDTVNHHSRENTFYSQEIESVLDRITSYVSAGCIGKFPAQVFYGPPGTGKTTIASVLPPLPLIYLEASFLCNPSTLMSASEQIRRRAPPSGGFYLIIEELDKIQDWTSFQHGILNNILDGPYTLPGQITLITCNCMKWTEPYPSLMRPGRVELHQVDKATASQIERTVRYRKPEWKDLSSLDGLDCTTSQLVHALSTVDTPEELVAKLV